MPLNSLNPEMPHLYLSSKSNVQKHLNWSQACLQIRMQIQLVQVPFEARWENT